LNEFKKKTEGLFPAASFTGTGGTGNTQAMVSKGKKVLLVLTGNVSDSKSFSYALNVAKRIEANVEVLYFSGRRPSDEALGHFRYLTQRSDVPFDVSQVSGCMKTRILEYTTKRSDIQFVVAESIEVLNDDCQQEGRSLRGALRKLKCPLVLVSEFEQT
jgi:hypothetical protein